MIHLIKPADVPHAIAAVRGELSQRKLATLTGFGQSQIADWETGGRQPGLGSLMRLCAVRPWELALLPRQATGSRLGDLIVETGPYVAGGIPPAELKQALGQAAAMNELRDELLRLREGA